MYIDIKLNHFMGIPITATFLPFLEGLVKVLK